MNSKQIITTALLSFSMGVAFIAVPAHAEESADTTASMPTKEPAETNESTAQGKEETSSPAIDDTLGETPEFSSESTPAAEVEDNADVMHTPESTSVPDEKETEESVTTMTSASETNDQTGEWKKDNTGWWYQYADGSYPKNELLTIDGKSYLFNADGYMCTGWQYHWGSWYFFAADGSMLKDQWIDNTYYLDYSGRMAVNQTIDGKYLGGDGKVTDVNKHGWAKEGDGLYYYHDAKDNLEPMRTIDGKVYHFTYADSLKWKAVAGQYDVSIDDNKAYVFFGKDYSKLSGWAEIDGNWKYFDPENNGYAVISSWKTINGKKYYFGPEGEMKTGVVSLDDGTGKTNEFCFAPSGELLSDQWFSPYADIWNYAAADGTKLKDSWVKSNGKYYHLNDMGDMDRFQAVHDGKGIYYVNADGEWVTGTGWIAEGSGDYSRWRYIENGMLVYHGWKKINGTYYAFADDGCMVSSDVVNDHGKFYLLGEDGSWVQNPLGWVEENNLWFYFDKPDHAYQGLLKYNGNEYFMGGRYGGYYDKQSDGFARADVAMNKGMIILPNGDTAYFDNDGKKLSKAPEGWFKLDNTWYYYRNGKPVEDEWVGGYYLDQGGAMATTDMIQTNADQGYQNSVYCLFDANGNKITKTGWHYIESFRNYWAYVKDGVGYEGFVYSNGSWYYTFKHGTYAQNENVYYKDNEYFFDADGKMLTGWFVDNGKWYYADNSGAMLRETVAIINGKRYIFDWDGVAMKGYTSATDGNGVYSLYYIDNNWNSEVLG